MSRKIVIVLLLSAALVVVAVGPLLTRNHFAMTSRGKPLTIVANKTVNGDVLVANADARIAGTVNGSVIVRHGDMFVEKTGCIGHDAVAIGGKLHIEKGAQIGGKRVVAEHSVFGGPLGGHGRLNDPHRSGVNGPLDGHRPPPGFGPRGFGVSGPPTFMIIQLLLLGIFIGIAMLLVKGKNSLLDSLNTTIDDRMLGVILAGVVAHFVLLFAFRSAGAYVGFPFAAIAGLLLNAIMLATAIIPAQVFGMYLSRLCRFDASPIQNIAIGATAIVLGILLPFIGRFFLIGFSTIGIGSLIVMTSSPTSSGTH
ncbi:MAG TPA: hypothetical protein VGK02_06960 [Candidatus Aquicultor sp.]|jgi:hypothetical protein